MASERLLSFVIPVYRSEAFLAATVTEFVSFFESLSAVEVILVNDASPFCAASPKPAATSS